MTRNRQRFVNHEVGDDGADQDEEYTQAHVHVDFKSAGNKRKRCGSRARDDVSPVPAVGIGMSIRKLFDDGMYYNGSVISGPYEVFKETGQNVFAWRVRYEDGDEEDLEDEELQQWYHCRKGDHHSEGSRAVSDDTETASNPDSKVSL
jgi:hypothetical protein